jgi:hypothetical protein
MRGIIVRDLPPPLTTHGRMERFDAPLAGGLRLVTRAGVALVAAAAALAAGKGMPGTAILLLAGLAALFLLSVRGYAVEGSVLRILRPGWSVRVELAGLESVEPAPDLVARGLSLWSTRGVFGAIGSLYVRREGRVRAYVTDPSATLLLRFRGRRAVAVSPTGRERFAEALHRAAGSGSDAPQLAARPPPPAPVPSHSTHHPSTRGGQRDPS